MRGMKGDREAREEKGGRGGCWGAQDRRARQAARAEARAAGPSAARLGFWSQKPEEALRGARSLHREGSALSASN